MDRRGPKLGDAASLWNFTPSPGWTKEESLILKLCLLKFGLGQWVQIQATGLLPGKLIQQLNGATQRLLGQQSLAAFSGLRVDIDRIRAENAAKTGERRKNGLIIWGGANPTKEMKLQWQQEAREKYGLTPEQQQEAEAAYEEMAAAVEAQRAAAAAAAGTAAPPAQQGLPPGCDIMGCDVQELTTFQKQQLLCTLHARLAQLVAAACQQQPQAAQLLTYLQQPQQGWIATGLPLQQAAAAADGATENLPGRANLLVRQAGRGGKAAAGSKAARGSKADKPPSGKGSSKGGRKRSRGAAGSATCPDDDVDNDDDDFMQQGPPRRRRGGSGRAGSSGSTSAEGGGPQLAELMRVALDAGVAQLAEMGYSRSKALDALKECGCDVELAVEYLSAACC